MGFGVRFSMVIGAKFGLSRHFLTKMSSWENDHSSAESRVVRPDWLLLIVGVVYWLGGLELVAG